jgi:hypothetical protein
MTENAQATIVARLHAALGAEDETALLEWIRELKHPGGWLQVGEALAPLRSIASESQEMGLAVEAMGDALEYAKRLRGLRKGKGHATPWSGSVERRGKWRYHLGHLHERLATPGTERKQSPERVPETLRVSFVEAVSGVARIAAGVDLPACPARTLRTWLRTHTKLLGVAEEGKVKSNPSDLRPQVRGLLVLHGKSKRRTKPPQARQGG